MKKLVKLIRLSSKEAFRKLRNLGEIYSINLGKSFTVSNLFLNHISGSSKNREISDIIERLSSINLVELVSEKGELVETRENIYIENRRFFQKTYKLKYSLKDFEFFLILGEKSDGKIILISIFLNYLE